MPAQMTASQQEQFAKAMMDQGVQVMRTTKGFFLRLPNGESTTVHFTLSDVRAQKNLFSVLRRAGVRHPEDPKNVEELPASITEAPPVAERSKRKVKEMIENLDWPKTVTIAEVVNSTEMAHITATKTLYQMGFRPVKGKHNARNWRTPDSILALKPEDDVDQLGTPASDQESPTFEEAMNPTRDEKEVARLKAMPFHDNSPDREFIDTHDSWTVDLDRVSQYTRVHEYIDSLRAAGLEVEIRVWKA